MGKRTDKYKSKESKQVKSKNITKTILNIIFYAICLALVVGSLLFVFDKNEKKSFFGFRIYNVQTNSMKPGPSSPPGGFVAGDMIAVKLCDPETVKVGDIITFVPGNDSETYLTHRVVNILTELNGEQGLFFVTKGDTNNSEDPPFKSDKLIGKKIFSVPKMGSVIKFISENKFIVIAFVGVVIFFISILSLFLNKSKK